MAHESTDISIGKVPYQEKRARNGKQSSTSYIGKSFYLLALTVFLYSSHGDLYRLLVQRANQVHPGELDAFDFTHVDRTLRS